MTAGRGSASLACMSLTPPGRKKHPGPDLGLAPGERGFAKWLRQTIAEAEEEARREGTISAKEMDRMIDDLLGEHRAGKSRRQASR